MDKRCAKGRAEAERAIDAIWISVQGLNGGDQAVVKSNLNYITQLLQHYEKELADTKEKLAKVKNDWYVVRLKLNSLIGKQEERTRQWNE